MADLVCENLNMTFTNPQTGGVVEALKDINFTLKKGELLSVLGPSGCGKTTLLNLIAGFLNPTSGSAALGGREIDGPGVERGMVFQQGALFEWLPVSKNVDFGLRMKSTDPAVSRELVEKWLNIVGLQGFGDTPTYQLSGGMQQRVAIAQALIMEPQIILLDEPFGALDEATREELQEMLLQFYEENKEAMAEGKKPPYTLIIVTHELNEAIRVGDRLVGLSQYWDWKADGHDRCPGATVVYDKPAPVFRADERPDYELFADIRREIRQVVYNPEGLQRRDEHVNLNPTS